MIISVRFYSLLRFKLDCAELEVVLEPPATIRTLLDQICARFNHDIRADLLENDAIKKGTIILIDGKNVLHLQHLDTPLDGECEVSLFPPSGGG